MEVYNMRNADDNLPQMIECRYTGYKHTGIRIDLATIVTGIPPTVRVLDDYEAGRQQIRTALEHYFHNCHNPATNDDVFLPGIYTPFAAVTAIDDIRNGTKKNTGIEKYLISHKGALVLDIDSIYINYRANSWLVKLWMDHCNSSNYPVTIQ